MLTDKSDLLRKLPWLKDPDDVIYDYTVTNDPYSYKPFIWFNKETNLFCIDFIHDDFFLDELSVIGNTIEEVIEDAYNKCKQLNLIKNDNN